MSTLLARQMGGSLLVWSVASAGFLAELGVALFAIDTFGPHGDAGFGFGLGLIPSLVVATIGYIGLSGWALFSSFTKSESLSEKLRFFVVRFLLVGGAIGGLVVINAAMVYRKYFIH